MEAMQIAEILDDTSLVITGKGVEELAVGVNLLVLAVGGRISGTSIPLVVPKAELEVTTAAGLFAIARPPSKTRQEEDPLARFSGSLGPRTITYRPQLQVDPSEKRGNPAHSQVRVGDPVIRPAFLADYVRSLAGETKD